jgi:hypothetical protein
MTLIARGATSRRALELHLPREPEGDTSRALVSKARASNVRGVGARESRAAGLGFETLALLAHPPSLIAPREASTSTKDPPRRRWLDQGELHESESKVNIQQSLEHTT